jgi:glycerol uptake facilitator protein
MTSPFLGEFMGTMVLCLMGNSNVANVVLKKSKAEGSGWMVIATGWAMAVMLGVFTAIACGSSDAHINPAVTLGMAVRSGDFSKIPTYFAAQLLGAFVGGVLAWLNWLPHWGETKDEGLKLAVFSTGPAIKNATANLIAETMGTMVLVLSIAAIFSKGVSASGPVAGLGPFLVGGVVWGVGLCMGGATGFAINPARDLGPRIAHAILPIPGKGGSDWGYAPIPVVGGLLGGALAGLLLSGIGM